MFDNVDQNKIIKILAITVASLCLLCIIGLIAFGLRGVTPGGDDSEDPVTTAPPPSQEEPTPTILEETADFGQDYINKFVFVGDSTTYGMKAYNVVAESQVWTPKSGTLSLQSDIDQKMICYFPTQEEYTIANAAKTFKPEYMVITLGINNGVPSLDKEAFQAFYQKLISAVKEAAPDTTVILQSIFPVTKAYSDNDKNSITNEKINVCNTWIIELAEANSLKYLNTAEVLKDADGALREELCNDGELHLEKIGLELVISYIRTHGYSK